MTTCRYGIKHEYEYNIFFRLSLEQTSEEIREIAIKFNEKFWKIASAQKIVDCWTRSAMWYMHQKLLPGHAITL